MHSFQENLYRLFQILSHLINEKKKQGSEMLSHLTTVTQIVWWEVRIILWRRKWQPTPVFLPGESQGWRSLLGAVYGVAQSWTWLMWLSSSSSKNHSQLFSHHILSIIPGNRWQFNEGHGKKKWAYDIQGMGWYILTRRFNLVISSPQVKLELELGKADGNYGNP